MEKRNAADGEVVRVGDGLNETCPLGDASATAPLDARAPAVPDRPATTTAPIDPAATIAMAVGPRRVATFPYQPGDMILPGYRLTRPIGRGGFGEVWRAEAPGGMGVAIKILANLGRREGGREFRALQTIKNIRHAHIVPMFGVWLKSKEGHVLDTTEVAEAERRILAVPGAVTASDDRDTEADGLESLELIVAMGLGDQTLFDRLKEARRGGEEGLPPGQVIQWMQQAALALDHFNSRSRTGGENITAVQHCDIKPQNMLLVGDVVQVCDFGLARAQGEVRATSNTMASLAYAAPEMVSPPYDPAPTTDQYSLALTYVELRTGRLPYTELNPVAIMRAKIDGVLDLAKLPEAERRILQRALSVDPARRFQSCGDFVRTLKASAPSAFDTASLADRQGTPGVRTESVAAAITRDETTAIPPAPHASLRTDAPAAHRSLVLGAGITAATLLLAGVGYAIWTRGGGGAANPGPAPAATAGGGVSATPVPPRVVPGSAADRPQAAGGESAISALARAKDLEAKKSYAAAAAEYAIAHAKAPETLAKVLWDLQTKADVARQQDQQIPVLVLLEQVFTDDPTLALRAKDGTSVRRWDVLNTLAWLRATRRGSSAGELAEARRMATDALALVEADQRSQSLDTLAAVLAASGEWDEAVRTMEEAIGLAADDAQKTEFTNRLERYRRHEPWIEP